MRTVTLTGTMNLHSLLQTGSSEQLAFLVKQGLESYGWGVQSVSISRASIFNNQLNVTIVINALGDAVSQQIDDRVTNFLNNFPIDDNASFSDARLSITGDTGAETVTAASQPSTPAQPTRTVIRKAPQTIDRGVLATVTIDPNAPENQLPKPPQTDFWQTLADDFNVTKQTAQLVTGLLFIWIWRS